MHKLFFLFAFIILFNNLIAQESYVISEINIVGNKKTHSSIILRELYFSIGDTIKDLDLDKIVKKSEENLKNLRLFNFCNIEYNNDGEKITILIFITERWYIWPYPIIEVSDRNFNSWWEEFAESDFKDYTRLNYGVFLEWKNFRGKNELIKIKFRKGFKEHYQIAYQIPFINYKKTFGMNFDFELFRRKKTYYNSNQNQLLYVEDEDFTSKDIVLQTELIYKPNLRSINKLNLSYFKTFISKDLFNLNNNYLSNQQLNGDYLKLTYSFINDNRDYIEYPLSGYYLSSEFSKNINLSSPVKNLELILRLEKYLNIVDRLYIGNSIKTKWTTNEYQPYFSQIGLGFDDYIRSYEYYVIDGQKFWINKFAMKYEIMKPNIFNIPYLKLDQFKKSHFSIYFTLFSDLGYVYDSQNLNKNSLSNTLLFGNGFSLDFVTYYDKLIRIEFSINKLGEKGIFLHFSNPFGFNKK